MESPANPHFKHVLQGNHSQKTPCVPTQGEGTTDRYRRYEQSPTLGDAMDTEDEQEPGRWRYARGHRRSGTAIAIPAD